MALVHQRMELDRILLGLRIWLVLGPKKNGLGEYRSPGVDFPHFNDLMNIPHDITSFF